MRYNVELGVALSHDYGDTGDWFVLPMIVEFTPSKRVYLEYKTIGKELFALADKAFWPTVADKDYRDRVVHVWGYSWEDVKCGCGMQSLLVGLCGEELCESCYREHTSGSCKECSQPDVYGD